MIPQTHHYWTRTFLVLLVSLVACSPGAQVRVVPSSSQRAEVAGIDLQGHRGARGLLPENSVPSMLVALDHGVRTLELDVVVTRDRYVLLSHEPWMSSVICRAPNGNAISEEEERSFNIYDLDLDETAAFDCGSRGHPSFPRQRPTASAKPVLQDVIRIADGYAYATGRPMPYYNVEIKSNPENDGRFHPPPDSFARLVYDVLVDESVAERTTIQSFDPRAIRAVRALAPDQEVALLVNNDDGFDANVRRLGFTPDVYSPNKRLVDRGLIEMARQRGVKIVPWTVNLREEMHRLLNIGVDGIITDYPDIGREAVDDFLRRMQHH